MFSGIRFVGRTADLILPYEERVMRLRV